jgi:hypothetical protein
LFVNLYRAQQQPEQGSVVEGCDIMYDALPDPLRHAAQQNVADAANHQVAQLAAVVEIDLANGLLLLSDLKVEEVIHTAVLR